METIFTVLIIAAVYVSYRVSKNKGYSGVLFGIGALFFPILAFIVFALPNKWETAKGTENENAVIREQQRRLDEMSARISELEKQQSSPQPEEEAPAVPEGKPVQKEFAGRKVNLNVESEGELADLIVEMEYAIKWYRDKKYFLALPYFRKGAEAGHLDLQMYCGQMYYHGQGCEVNYKEALYWYEKAAAQGQVTAQGNCSFMYQKGQGCDINLEKALYWKEKAAEQGDADTQFELGMMYELGQGCDVNLEKARLWYEKAAEQGHADAQRLLDGMEEF